MSSSKWIVVFESDNYETWMQIDGAEVWQTTGEGFDRLLDGEHPRCLAKWEVVSRRALEPSP